MGPDEVIATWMKRFLGRDDGGATDAQAAQPDRAAALGGLGEALVAGVVRELGWPALRNVVLRERASSAEFDLLVRAPHCIVVLEVKTWSGFVDGTAGAEEWVRYGAGGCEAGAPNAVRQNLAHVGMVERAIGAREVRVSGLVVSAGRARYSERLRRHVVLLADLAAVLRAHAAAVVPCRPASLDRAWAILTREADRSEVRREAHAAWVRSRRSNSTDCE
jgi:Nuclease-related domain